VSKHLIKLLLIDPQYVSMAKQGVKNCTVFSCLQVYTVVNVCKHSNDIHSRRKPGIRSILNIQIKICFSFKDHTTELSN